MAEPVNTDTGGTPSGTRTTTPAGTSYSLIASEQTVQVLSPTVVIDVQYCTIATQPSGSVVSWPLTLDQFQADQGQADLMQLAGWIETLLARPEVVAASGSQTLDASGLLVDNVVFTVQYTSPGTSGTSITGLATVQIGGGSLAAQTEQVAFPQRAEQAIGDVYAHLQNLAGG